MEIDDSSLQALDNSTDVLKVDNNPEVLSDTPGTFTDLQTVITGNTVELERNYTYDSDADRNIPKTGILIDSPIIIDGKGFTIDASHLSKIFNVTSSDVTFKNINFINANASAKVDKKDFSDCGAAIVAYSGMKGNENALNNISIIDCTFKDCYSAGHGAVYTFANNVTVTGSTFENNSAPQRGGAFYARGGKNIIVSQSKFNLNKQPLEGNNTLGGGAIYLYDCKATITDSSFDENYAHNGGAIYVQANNTVIVNCNFTNNEVTYDKANTGGGGAIYEQNQNNLTILNCRFEQNIAKHTGGAIYIHVSNNTIINGSTFFKNTVIDEGGAVYFYYCKNVTVGDCDFTANGGIRANDDSYGGAIRVHESDNTLIRDSNFTGNYVNHNAGGAIEYHSYNVTKGTILNCKFVNNTANSDGGAIYAHCKGEFNIIDCDFINNTVIDNQPVKSGGAVLINLKSEDENDTAFGNNALKTKILNSNFINNSAPLIGGGLVLRCNVRGYTFEDNIIENCTFIGNNATWGSAIFLYDGVKANLTNIVFGKNRANSTLLDITVDKEKSVYPSDVNLTVTFTGKDNIANAIWNGGHHTKQPFKEQAPSQVYLKNITYEIYHDGELKTVTVYKDELQNPVKGYKNAKPGENIWQDTLENAQNITIEIYNNEESSLVANISAPLTEINGAMSNIQKGLKPGNYTAKAYHKTDAYYTKASDSVDFEIIPNVELDVNKTADVNVVGNNSLVNYTISVKNNGVCNATDVKIIDQLPENLTYTGKWGIIKSEYAIEEISDLAWNVNKITNGSEVSIWFTAVVNTNNAGNITNVVNVTCNENKTEITGNKTIKVVPVVLTVNKTVDVNVTGNNTEVTFTIVVNNTSEVKATDVKVIDVLPEGLVFVDATDDYDFSISDDERTLTWVISEMANDPVELFVTVRTALTGNLTNNVSVTSKENNTNVTDNETVEVVPVVLTVNKTVDVNVTGNNTEVTFTIVVNNTSEVKATEVKVIDVLPEGLVYVDSTKSGDGIDFIISDDERTLTWVISEMGNDPVELFVTVRTALTGNLTNNVSVTSKENNTNVTDNETVEVVPVVLTVNKTVDVNVTGNNTEVTFTIVVNNTSEVKATEVKVIDVLPEGLVYVDSTKSGDGIDFIISDDERTLTWVISEMGNDPVELFVTVRTALTGNLTNNVSVTSKENNTKVTDNETVEVVPVVLTVNKTVDVNVTGNNTEVTFTIVVNNTSEVKATEVKVIDVLPEGLVFVDATDDYDFSISDDERTLTWVISEMGHDPVELFVTVRTALTGNLTNNVSVTSKENNTNVTDNETVEVVPVVLTVNKTVDVNVTGNNTEVTFTIVVNNPSKVLATDVIVVDVLPEGLVFVDATDDYDFSISDDERTLTWVISEMGHDPVELFVTVRTALTGNLTNNVSVTSKENNTNVTDNETVEVVPVILTVNKTANVTYVSNDTYVTFKIVVNNTSEVKSTNVVIIDNLPEGLEYVKSNTEIDDLEYSFKPSSDKKTFTWTIPEFEGSIELFITVKTTEYGDFTNNVTVTSNENNTPVKDNETVHVVPTNLTVVKIANVTTVSIGDLVEFTMNVTNTGLVKATNVNVTDILNSAFEVQSIGNETYLKYNDAQKIVWIIPSIDAGNSATVSVIVKLVKDGKYPNVVTVNCDENTTDVSNETNVISLPVVDLKINKTVDQTNVSVGDEVTYTITVTNLGPSVATNVNVTENMVGNVKITDVDTHNVGEYKDGIWYVGTLNKDDVVKLTITVKTLAVGIVENIVSVNSTEEDNDTSNNEYPCENVTVNPYPSIVNGTDVNVTYGDPIVVPYDSENATNVTYEIFDEDGNVVANGTVGPNGTVPVDQLPVGNYTVNWTTVVDGNHTPATNTSTITVNPAPSSVEGENVTVTYGDPIVVPYDSENATNVTYEIFDEDGNVVANGTVGPNGTVPVDQLPVGNYTVNWTTVVDGNHTPATNTSTITVNPAPSSVEGENVTVYYGDPIVIPYDSINATGVTYEIFDSEGNSIANGTVGPDGTVDVNQLPVGNYTVSWTTLVDGNHIPATNTSTITVLPIPTTITVGNVTAFPGENVTIPINVTTIDNVPFNGDVAVIMPDNSTQIVSVVNGTGIINWQVPEDYSPDKYPDSIRFPGSDIYEPSNGTGIIEVVKIPTQITVGNVTTYAGMEVTIPITVTAEDGNPFNGNVTITFPDGTTKTVEIINGEGTTTWFVPNDYTPETYSDTVKFSGDDKYLPSEGIGTITVIKTPVDIIVGNVTANPGDDVIIPIKVIPRDGSVYNGKITVELPDGTIKTVDIVNGKGNVPWKVPKDYKSGKYLVKAHSNETNVYYPADGTGIIKVIENQPVPPVDDGNKTHKDVPSKKNVASKKNIPQDSLERYETGNPIMALLAVLALLGVGIRRRK